MGKITSYTELSAVDNSDILVIVDDPSGTPATKKITAENLASLGYYRVIEIPVQALKTVNGTPTWTDPDANHTGGWRLDDAAEKLYGQFRVGSDWDAAHDISITVWFLNAVDNSGGSSGDTVDIQCVCYMGGIGDTSTKSQTLEEATTIGAAATYTVDSVLFEIDHDDGTNPVDSGDVISFVLNLETDTSEVDDIIITRVECAYHRDLPELTQ